MRAILAAVALFMMMPEIKAEPQLSPMPVAAACMPCQAKCKKCLYTGRFATLDACYQDCKAKGNPPSVAVCGVYKRC